jgi:hypothetical protein
MRKVIAYPIIAGLAAQPMPVPFMAGAGAMLTTGGILMLGGCAKSPGDIGDVGAIDIGVAVSNAVRIGCGVVPIASTFSGILIALALPAATPIQQQVALAAKVICDQINEVKAARRSPLRSVAPDGRPAVSYGPALVGGKPLIANGKIVEILVYQ